LPAPPATTARHVTSVVWWLSRKRCGARIIIVVGVRRCGRRGKVVSRSQDSDAVNTRPRRTAPSTACSAHGATRVPLPCTNTGERSRQAMAFSLVPGTLSGTHVHQLFPIRRNRSSSPIGNSRTQANRTPDNPLRRADPNSAWRSVIEGCRLPGWMNIDCVTMRPVLSLVCGARRSAASA
jgi:hypothetical protein